MHGNGNGKAHAALHRRRRRRDTVGLRCARLRHPSHPSNRVRQAHARLPSRGAFDSCLPPVVFRYSSLFAGEFRHILAASSPVLCVHAAAALVDDRGEAAGSVAP
jgi:hypothetical protein